MTRVREGKDVYKGCTSKAYKAYKCFRITLYIVLLTLIAFVIRDCVSPSKGTDGSEVVVSRTGETAAASFEEQHGYPEAIPFKQGMTLMPGQIATGTITFTIPRIVATFEQLLDAIEWVESKGDANAVGDNGNAIGAYQLHKIYVDDVNDRLRKIPDNKYSYADRFDKIKSREIVTRYLRYYEHKTPPEEDGHYPFGNMTVQERLARIHNGGPDGWKKSNTLWYWFEVKARLK